MRWFFVIFLGLSACADKDDSSDGSELEVVEPESTEPEAVETGSDADADADADGDGYDADVDCDDSDPAIHPDAQELCDDIDNNCDDQIDEGFELLWYQDGDLDGYGDPETEYIGCDPPKGYVTDNTDCNDTKSNVHPGAVDLCDGTDSDCDGDLLDENADSDGDGICDEEDTDDDNDGVPDWSDSDDGNEYVCSDTDNDGCEDCQSGSFDPANDGADYDGDGQCDLGDDDDDNDNVDDAEDADDNNANVCSDNDMDTCDDCASGSYNPANDGSDYDGDGDCDAGDPDDDNDAVQDSADSDDSNPNICSDVDVDQCDDCTYGYYNPNADGTDTDGDGLCDIGDEDDDGDGSPDDADNAPLNPLVCGDNDADSCDDCSQGQYNTSNDGTDTDGDGLCDDGDNDIDGDGATNGVDSDNYDVNECSDDDGDNCDDCSQGQYSTSNDGTDTDGDGLCDVGDPDDDNDGVNDVVDSVDNDPYQCSDQDSDGCDDCINGSFNMANDGEDTDSDGFCNNGDSWPSCPNTSINSNPYDACGICGGNGSACDDCDETTCGALVLDGSYSCAEAEAQGHDCSVCDAEGACDDHYSAAEVVGTYVAYGSSGCDEYNDEPAWFTLKSDFSVDMFSDNGWMDNVGAWQFDIGPVAITQGATECFYGDEFDVDVLVTLNFSEGEIRDEGLTMWFDITTLQSGAVSVGMGNSLVDQSSFSHELDIIFMRVDTNTCDLSHTDGFSSEDYPEGFPVATPCALVLQYVDEGEGCADLEENWGIDCSVCYSDNECPAECGYNDGGCGSLLDAGYTCYELESEYGYDCSLCEEAGECAWAQDEVVGTYRLDAETDCLGEASGYPTFLVVKSDGQADLILTPEWLFQDFATWDLNLGEQYIYPGQGDFAACSYVNNYEVDLRMQLVSDLDNKWWWFDLESLDYGVQNNGMGSYVTSQSYTHEQDFELTRVDLSTCQEDTPCGYYIGLESPYHCEELEGYGIDCSACEEAGECPGLQFDVACDDGSWQAEVSWSLVGTGLSGGAPYAETTSLIPGTYQLSMSDSFGDGWNGNVWTMTDSDGWEHASCTLDYPLFEGTCEVLICGEFQVPNCSGQPEDACCNKAWIGDGYADCEDQVWGCDLTCYDNDGGDCDSGGWEEEEEEEQR